MFSNLCVPYGNVGISSQANCVGFDVGIYHHFKITAPGRVEATSTYNKLQQCLGSQERIEVMCRGLSVEIRRDLAPEIVPIGLKSMHNGCVEFEGVIHLRTQ